MKSLFLILSLFISFYAHAADRPVSFDNLVNQEKQADEKRQDHNKIFFNNECDQTIHTFLAWKDIDGEWKADGPWILEPGQTAYVADTRNRNYYIAGTTEDESIIW